MILELMNIRPEHPDEEGPVGLRRFLCPLAREQMKDLMPGRYDVTVSGRVRAGKSVASCTEALYDRFYEIPDRRLQPLVIENAHI